MSKQQSTVTYRLGIQWIAQIGSRTAAVIPWACFVGAPGKLPARQLYPTTSKQNQEYCCLSWAIFSGLNQTPNRLTRERGVARRVLIRAILKKTCIYPPNTILFVPPLDINVKMEKYIIKQEPYISKID
jgi:hypothetical protein